MQTIESLAFLKINFQIFWYHEDIFTQKKILKKKLLNYKTNYNLKILIFKGIAAKVTKKNDQRKNCLFNI